MATLRAADIADQTPEIWATDLFAEAEDLTFFHNWEGESGSRMPVIRNDDLTTKAGDTIRTDIVLALDGAGQVGDTTSLEGNEEELRFRQASFTPEMLSHGVRWTEKAEIVINHNMRTTAKNQLARWLAGKLDGQVFGEFTGVTQAGVAVSGATTIPTANKWAAGSATSRDTVADGDATGRLTWDSIVEMRAYARSALRIEPIKVEDGEEYFVLVAHPYALMHLKRDDTKWAQAQREAQVRGDDNPLFTGAAGIVDGVILKESNRVPRYNNDDPIMVSDNVFLGAQALTRGYSLYPDWREELFDYGRSAGIAIVTMVGNKLTVFDLTNAGGASDANKTWIGGMVVYASAVAPGQP